MELRNGKVIGINTECVGVVSHCLPTVPSSTKFLQPDDIKSSIEEQRKVDTKEDYNPYKNYPMLSPSQVKQEDED